MAPNSTMTPWLRPVVVLFAIALAPGAPAQEVKPKPLDLVYKSLDLVYPSAPMSGATRNMENPGNNVAGAVRTFPQPTPQTMEIKETATELKINLLGDILFDFDKADIRKTAEPTLGQLVTIIQKYPNAAVLIEGYTDAKGSASYNLSLSQRRAAAVKTWLVSRGIPQQIVTTQGWGAARPVAPNMHIDGSDDPVGRQKNRRVEITIRK